MGNAPIYLSNYLIKLVAAKKLEEDKEFGVKGFEVVGELIKSRSASAGLKFNMIFDQVNGFDNIMSNYLLLKDEKIIQGGGRGYYLPNAPQIKFTQKEFKEKYLSNSELKEAFDELIKEQLTKSIPIPGNYEKTEELEEVDWEE